METGIFVAGVDGVVAGGNGVGAVGPLPVLLLLPEELLPELDEEDELDDDAVLVPYSITLVQENMHKLVINTIKKITNFTLGNN